MSDEDEEVTYTVVFDSEPDKKYTYLPPLDGRATATYPNKDTFVGEFKDGKKHGKGCYTFASGSKYDGEYFENKKQGTGKYDAPDGGVYEGEWYDDKRHGKGVYTYPTGDRYVGEWKNGTKHGTGNFFYAQISTSVQGTWSNGQCVDGVWSIHDGSSYTGSFLGNQPSGDGLFEFPTGNKASGRYQDGKFVGKSFTKPHPNAKCPEVTPPTALRVAERLIDKSISKSDHNGNIHVLKMEIAGLANFQRAGKTPVYGSGQPTLDALRKLNDTLTEAGFDKIVNVNLREDPIVYVNQLPFSPRDGKALNVPIVLDSSLTATNIKDLEERCAANAKFAVKRKGNLHNYYEEMYANPAAPTVCTGNDAKTIEVKDANEIRSVNALFEFLTEEDVAFEYQRVPVSADKAPSFGAFDGICATVRGLEGGCVVFNDAEGRDRTATAMAIAGLLVKEAEAEDDGGGDEEDEGDESKADKGPKLPPTYDEAEPDMKGGQYSLVMRLVNKINGPTKEELEALKVAEKEQFLADKKAAEEAAAAAKAEAEAEAAALLAEEGVAAAEPAAADDAEPAAEEDAPADEEAAEEAPADDAGEGDEGDEKKEEVDEFVSKLPAEASNLGDVLKMDVDEAINKSAAVCNLRTGIFDLKAAHDAADVATKDILKEKAINNVQRYCYLILFKMYVNEQQALGEEGFQTTFEQFSQAEGKKELFELLGTNTAGALSCFDWD